MIYDTVIFNLFKHFMVNFQIVFKIYREKHKREHVLEFPEVGSSLLPGLLCMMGKEGKNKR